MPFSLEDFAVCILFMVCCEIHFTVLTSQGLLSVLHYSGGMINGALGYRNLMRYFALGFSGTQKRMA